MSASLAPANLERQLLARGISLIAGIDEVGRGALAGPVCAGAVLLNAPTIIDRSKFSGVKDSKLVPRHRRGPLSRTIWNRAVAVSLGWVEAREIDEIGIAAAVRRAMVLALAQLRPRPQALITDAVALHGPAVPELFFSFPKADRDTLSVGAASICAKVARDAHMRRLESMFPGYGFEQNVGYGTSDHLTAIAAHGPSRAHRLSFGPCRPKLTDRSDAGPN